MTDTEKMLRDAIAQSVNRFEIWANLLQKIDVARLAEIGVYQGEFAEHLLRSCSSIEQYYLIDPWRQLDAWEKPANVKSAVFERYLQEALARTEFAADKRVVLRGKTTEVIDAIADNSLDFAYIDGDHTLKGITIDLIRLYPKIRNGGWIGGDDFSSTVWQHRTRYEPTLVFPFTVYFAEAMGARLYALPHNQFLLEKAAQSGHEFIDLTCNYAEHGLRQQFRAGNMIKLRFGELFPWFKALLQWLRRLGHRSD